MVQTGARLTLWPRWPFCPLCSRFSLRALDVFWSFGSLWALLAPRALFARRGFWPSGLA